MTAAQDREIVRALLQRLAVRRALAAIDADFREPFIAAMRLIPGGLDAGAVRELLREFANHRDGQSMKREATR